ncbi:MAG: uracil-DNA glycosylase [Desulfobulbaceae bacterium]|nr:MAG: uracil-DNA glycosylase [Desulfobulbaceae bacterium]
MAADLGSGDTNSYGLPLCRKCRFYYITHDPGAPYGCRAMHFKSKRNPALIVYESSGMHCQLFQRKNDNPASGTKQGFKI